MRIQIDLDDSIVSKIQKIADRDQRSRKNMIEMMIQKSVQSGNPKFYE